MLFKDSVVYDSVNKAREFMFKDIEKTIGLAKNPQLGAPNFLLALGLCCFTEQELQQTRRGNASTLSLIGWVSRM